MLSKLVFKSSIASTLRQTSLFGKTLLKKAKASQLHVFRFSTNVEKSKSKLSKALSKELKHEEENYQKDDTVDSTLRETGFELKEFEGENVLELTKFSGTTKVVISFQSRAPQFNDQEEGQDQESTTQPQKQEGEEDGQQDFQDYCEFTVYLIKKSGSALAFECSSYDSEITINNVATVENLEKYQKTPRYERTTAFYGGPEFNTLDERLQTSLIDFLKGHGVTEEVAALVEHLSLDKEQRLYMRWLKNLTSFVDTD